MIGMQMGDYLDALEEALPDDHPALIQDEKVITWSELGRRSNNLARALRARGIEPRDKAAFYMHNCSEYLECLAACLRGSYTHVNVNYRYLRHELAYLFDNSDATVVFYGADLGARLQEMRAELPKIKVFVEIGGKGEPVIDGAFAYEDLISEGDGSKFSEDRSEGDNFFLYTGGTTGMPKAVMWDHYSLRLGNHAAAAEGLGPPQDLEGMRAWFKENPPSKIHLPACPLMHGTGIASSNATLMGGGTVVLVDNSGSLEPHEIWRAIDQSKVTHVSLVGDIFARPLLEALDEKPGHYATDQIVEFDSAGVMWSREVKHGLLEHMPQAIMRDNLASSEAPGMGGSITTKGQEVSTAKFTLSPTCKVFDENDNEVIPGSDVKGQLAVGGVIPMGYFKDEDKTAETFRVIDGERYVIPGDWVTVDADGTLNFLGRGSVCINTGGEKVFPEEVEEAIKRLDGVRDAIVVGVPDAKWGEAVSAVVRASNVNEASVIEHVRGELANYKVPKHVYFKQDLGRAPNGKADYKGIKEYAVRQLEED